LHRNILLCRHSQIPELSFLNHVHNLVQRVPWIRLLHCTVGHCHNRFFSR